MKSLFQNHIIVAVSSSILALFIVVGMSLSPFFGMNGLFDWANRQLQDVIVAGFSDEYTTNTVVVVWIDDTTLTTSGWLGRWQDFRRTYYADVIRNLRADGARVIGLDILFSDVSNSQEDSQFSQAIQQAGNVVLGRSFFLSPIKEFAQYAVSIGHVNPYEDPLTKNIRWSYPIQIDSWSIFESFALANIRIFLDSITGKERDISMSNLYNSYYKFHYWEYFLLPTAGWNTKNILMHQYITDYKNFSTVSFVDVFKKQYPVGSFSGKIVLIGYTASSLDQVNTPVGIMPGVFVHANAIESILAKRLIHFLDPMIEILFLILLAFLLAFIGLSLHNRIVETLFIGITLFTIIGFQLLSYTAFNLLFSYPVEMIFLVGVNSIIMITYKYLHEEKGKTILKNALSQYLAEDLVTAVLEKYESVKLGGAKKEITVFFSDIAGFTGISEDFEPEVLMKFLSTYLEHTSRIILTQKWFINKYEWDAIMALWWALIPDPSHSQDACEAALLQQEKIQELNTYFEKEFWFRITVRMGIHRWEAIVGNIWIEGKKIEFTAVGDTVNSASRLEWLNKFYSTHICVSEAIYHRTKEKYVFRLLDRVQMKWKQKVLHVYELLWRIGEFSLEQKQRIDTFEKGLLLYFSGDFSGAELLFQEVLLNWDAVASVFLERIRILSENPPWNWDGVYKAEEK